MKLRLVFFQLTTASIVLLLLTIVLKGCGRSDKDRLSIKFDELTNDKEFDCADLQTLHSFIESIKKEDRNVKMFYPNGQLDTIILNKNLHERCERQKIVYKHCGTNPVSIQKINIFLENSGSMDGYVRGITEYESALADIMVEAAHHFGKEKIAVNFINAKVYPSQIDDISVFFKSLDPSMSPFNVGNRSVSELNKLFETILDSTKKSDISILVSDCIYSLDKSKSTLQGLVFEQNLTKSVFLSKSKEFPISAYVFQMYSSFDGNYYDHLNNRTVLNKAQRPYYIWVLGKDELVSQFLENRNPNKYKGYANSYYFTGPDQSLLRFELLGSTEKIGRWRVDRKDHSNIENIKLKDGQFQFAIALDLKNYPDKNILMDRKSYSVTPGFEIVDVKEIPEENESQIININDWKVIGQKKYSHLVIVRNTERVFPPDFKLKFTNNLPTWVSSLSTDDDTAVLKTLDKTFGLQYLMEGVKDAYNTMNKNDNTLFSISLKLNQ